METDKAAWLGVVLSAMRLWHGANLQCHCMMLCTRRMYAPIGVHTQGWFHPWSFAMHIRGSRTPSLGTRLDPTAPQQLLLPCHAAPATRKANPVLNWAAGPHWSEYLVVTRDQKEQLRRQQTTCIYIYIFNLRNCSYVLNLVYLIWKICYISKSSWLRISKGNQ